MRSAVLALLLCAVPAAGALRPERVVLRTDAGDLVLALYDDAPKHAAKFLALARAGAYDATPLAKVDATRFAAFSGAIKPGRSGKLPHESGGPHRFGVLTAAHQPGDPDPGETAFVILFADIPAMNGRFSSFGELAGGRDVFEALKTAPIDGSARPVRPIAIRSTEVFADESALAKTTLRGPDLKALGRDESAERRLWLIVIAAMFLASAAAIALLGIELGPASTSFALLAALCGFFALFAAFADSAASSAWISVPLFAATVGVFRLMARFER